MVARGRELPKGNSRFEPTVSAAALGAAPRWGAAPTEPAGETGAWTVATGDQAPLGYEGRLVMTYSPVRPYVGVLAGGFGGDCPP